ncbi:hypothetical protein Tco_0881846 [Tanacetum coccineum]
MFNLLKGTCKSSVELEYHMEECFRALTDKLDWLNPEGYDRPVDMTKPLPLQEKNGRLIIPIEVFFNNDLEYLKGKNSERIYSSSITKTPAARVEDVQLGVESYQRKLNLTRPQRSYLGIETDEIYKFYDGTLQLVHTTLLDRLKNLSLRYNRHSDMPLRAWTVKDQKHTKIMLTKMDDVLLKRRIMISLEVLVRGRNTEKGRRLLERTI